MSSCRHVVMSSTRYVYMSTYRHVASGCGSVVGRVQLDAEVMAAGVARCDERRAGAAEWIQHHCARPAERLDQRRQHLDGLLGWMQAVAGIAPLQHVRDGQGRALHLALGEKVGGLVLGSEEPGFRSVALAKDDMCDGRILQGDCTQHMRAMPGRSVDFILTDPPYVTRYRDRSGRSVANNDMSTHRPVDESAGKEGADERGEH